MSVDLRNAVAAERREAILRRRHPANAAGISGAIQPAASGERAPAATGRGKQCQRGDGLEVTSLKGEKTSVHQQLLGAASHGSLCEDHRIATAYRRD